MYRKILLLYLLWLPYIRAAAQPYWENYDLLTTRQGLPHNIVLSLLQDSEGYLWVGTYNGLCRYNGHSFKIYKDVFGPAQSNNWFHAIEAMFEDHRHNIWIGARGGMVSRFDMHSQKFYPCRHLADFNKVQAFFEDSRGRIWVGHQNGACGIVNEDSIEYGHTVKAELLGIDETPHDEPLVITGNGIVYEEGSGRWKPYPIEGIPPGDIYDAVKAGKYWLLHTNDGRILVDIQERHIIKTLPLPKNRIIYVKQAATPHGFIIAEAFGLKIFDNTGQCTDSMSISPDAWNNNHEIHNCLLQDRSGIVWLGTNSGLYKIDPQRYRFKKYSRNNGMFTLGDNYIRAICPVGNELWTGTKAGRINRLVYDEGQHRYVFKDAYDLKGAVLFDAETYTINTILPYKGNLLAAGEHNAIYIRKGQNSYFEAFKAIQVQDVVYGIWVLYADSMGNIWIGTHKQGLRVWEAATGKLYAYNDKGKGDRNLPALSVWNIYRDRNNTVWLGTDNGLFCVHNPQDIKKMKLQRYPLQVKDKQQVNVWSFAEDRFGNLWLTTTGHGLFQITKARDRCISYGHRPSNVIASVVADTLDNLWISTINGMYRYDIVNMQFTPYDEQDGLLNNDFNFKAAAITPYHTVFFGNKTGLLGFSPADMAGKPLRNSTPRISMLRISGIDTPAAIYAKKTVRLPYNKNFIDIGFALPEFSKPLSHRYRYRLQPFDPQWREAGHEQPAAAYTNLPPGSYRFVVYDAADGVHWSKTPAVFNFVIRPAFWQTLWFRAGGALLILLLTAWLLYRRVLAVVNREREKNRIEKEIASLELRALQAQMDPHFIFNAINSIQHFVLHNDVLAANDYLSRFARLMRLFLESSKNRYISLQNELELLHLYVQLEQLRFEDKFAYEIEVDKRLDKKRVNIPPSIVQPFIENAIHHGLVHLPGKGHLHISFAWVGGDKLVCTIDDNGIGRKQSAALKEQQGRRHISRGMQLIEERVKTYNFIDGQDIQIHITDKEQGTRVEIILPATLQATTENKIQHHDKNSHYR